MYIFTCEDRFEDMMCCIYQAWEKALKVGHGCVRLEKRGEEQPSLFDEYVHVEYDEEEYKKVALDAAYRFLISGFKAGSDIAYMRTDLAVTRIKDIRRRVVHEIRYFTEFARFNSIQGKIYVCHLEPKSDVIYEVSLHFADRMPSENWMIIDDNRKKAVVHPVNNSMYIRHFTDEDMLLLQKTEKMNTQICGRLFLRLLQLSRGVIQNVREI